MSEFQKLRDLISEFSSIVIFRHINPDCDALGSQFGLREWLRRTYPEKTVLALGKGKSSQGVWPQSDEADDGLIRDSLAIVLDTATSARVDDERYSLAAKIVRIDHHPNFDHYGDEAFVHPEAAAVCEILASWFESENIELDCLTASYLYKGLLTDTLSFSTGNTTRNTLRAAAYLAQADIDIPSINRELFDLTMDEFRLSAMIRSSVVIEDCGVAHLCMSVEDQEKFGLSGSDARGHIDEIGHVKDFKAWAMFTERDADGMMLYDGSLRSKAIAVNEIAAVYGGGGHRNAAGVKGLSREEMDDVIARMCNSAENKP